MVGGIIVPEEHEPGASSSPFTPLRRREPEPMTVVAPLMKLPPQLTPKQALSYYSPAQWEEFTQEWVEALELDYVEVVGMGGSNDKGADIAAFLTEHGSDGEWHCYQCKHYQQPLMPSDAHPEILKILLASVQGVFAMPSRYVFVAPRIGPTLGRLLTRPGELRETFLADLRKPTNKGVAELPPGVLQQVLDLASATDFSMFKGANLDRILDQHRKTSYHQARFGTPLPDRPAVQTPPEDHDVAEARYIQQLLSVYEERFACSAESPEAARRHPKAGPHLSRQREAFYCAESLRVFARDHVPEGTFDSLQRNIYDGVVEVESRDFPTGFDRLGEVLQAAISVQLPDNILVSVVTPNDRKGLCHQLANEDRLIWCQGESP